MASNPAGITKAPTGITGLDELTFGGLPVGRSTLVCGGAGCGKTLLGLTFLVNGAALYGEPGVFVSFEEQSEELIENAASLGFDIAGLVAGNRLAFDYVRLDPSEIEEAGAYDLGGLFVRLAYAIDSVGAKRVVLDTIEALFSGLSNAMILRSELRRLFGWLKEKGISAIVTAERGDGTLTRHGIEEYVSDCVILLDQRVQDQISTRRLRVVKYRGSMHGGNEYPFLIGAEGISVYPITSSSALQHTAVSERVSSGIPGLDAMLGGLGYFRGSGVLVSGGAGTGKSTFAAAFVDAACRRGERCLLFAFEESASQIVRNMGSVGIDLKPWTDSGLLHVHSAQPGLRGLEMHLAIIQHEVQKFGPVAVVFDPISGLVAAGTQLDVNGMLLRIVDHLKTRGVTALFTSVVEGSEARGSIASTIDTWIVLRADEAGGEQRRSLYVRKSRGMAHSLRVAGFGLTDKGVVVEG
jgi:circadian clock protein KaiC